MRREDFVIEGIPPGYEVWDVDLSPDGTPACVLKNVHDRTGAPLLMYGSVSAPLPDDSGILLGDLGDDVRPPIVRLAGSDTFVIARSSARPGEENVWVLGRSGDILHSFHAGDAVAEVLASEDRIVIGYFDEGIFEGTALDLLAVLDLAGNLVTGYWRGSSPDERVSAYDTRRAVWSGDSEVTFFSYCGDGYHPLVRWRIDSMTQEIWSTPKSLFFSEALTCLGDRIFFHAPYADSGLGDRIIEWKIGDDDFEVIGRGYRRGRLRGLPGGRFIAANPGGYTILSFD